MEANFCLHVALFFPWYIHIHIYTDTIIIYHRLYIQTWYKHSLIYILKEGGGRGSPSHPRGPALVVSGRREVFFMENKSTGERYVVIHDISSICISANRSLVQTKVKVIQSDQNIVTLLLPNPWVIKEKERNQIPVKLLLI